MDNFENTFVVELLDTIWLAKENFLAKDSFIVCQAFYKDRGETTEEMLDKGSILVPYLYKGEEIFVEVEG